MAAAPTAQETDPRWRKLVKLAVHEFRNPLGVAAGYLRMVLKESVGPLGDQQRKLLEEVEKSCQRLSDLLKEVGDLSNLESGTVTLKRDSVDIRTLLADVIANLPPSSHYPVTVELLADGTAPMLGDASRLTSAFRSVISALRRELIASDRLAIDVRTFPDQNGTAIHITVGDAERIDQLKSLAPSELSAFDEWRGGIGLSLPTARLVIEAHGGRLLAPADEGKAAAFISLPGV